MRSDDYMVAASKTDPLDGYGPGGAITERAGNVEVLRLLHYAMGVCTEAGELLDVAKRALVYGAPIDWVNVVEEVGDLQWYEARMLDMAGSSFSEAMERNVAKLRARFPDGFTEHDAQVRDLASEREVLEGQYVPAFSASLEERTRDIGLDAAVESPRAMARDHRPTASEWRRSTSWDERLDSPGMVRLCMDTGDAVAFVRDDGSGMVYSETSAEFPMAARKETAALCDAHLRRDGWVLTAETPVEAVPLRSDLTLESGCVFNVICLEKYEAEIIVAVADPLYRWGCLVESCLPHGSKYLVQLKALSALEAIPAIQVSNPCSAPGYTGHPSADPVLTPAHYQGEREVIDLIRDSMDDHAFMGFCWGNALKYAHRAGRKGSAEEDQAKAMWYRAMQAHVRSIDNPDPREAREDWDAWRDDYERKGEPTLLHPLLTSEGEGSTFVLLDPGRGGLLPDGVWALSMASQGQVATFTGGEDGESRLHIEPSDHGTTFEIQTAGDAGQKVADLSRLAAIGEAIVRDIASPGAEDDAVKHATVEETLEHVRQAMTAWRYNQGKE